ncbi:MAG: dihydrofolate reductase family protein [Dehalococcoidia bacterium]
MPADDAPDLTPGRPDYAGLTFPLPPADRPYVIVNMVSSVDGRVAIEGTERGLGSPTDQALMRELRVHADVVLNGASTLRASGSSPRLNNPDLEALRRARGKPSLPLGAVLSASGDLPLDRIFFTAQDFQTLVYLATSAPATRRAAIEATGRTVVPVPADDAVRAALTHMHREIGARLVLVEGGPTLNGALLDAGLVDELFMTLGGVLVGGSDPLTIVSQRRTRSADDVRRLQLLGAHPNPATNEVYLRYRLLPPTTSART